MSALVNFGGGAIRTLPKVEMVMWGHGDTGGEVRNLTRFFSGLGTGHDRWSRILEQYGVRYPHHVLRGRWWDPRPAPANPTPTQTETEVARAVRLLHLATSVQVILVSEASVTPSGYGVQWCAYHSSIGKLQFAALGYVPGTLGCLNDTVIVSHEYAEMLTDPQYFGWTASGFEIADLCEWGPPASVTLATGTFPVARLWSNRNRGCVSEIRPVMTVRPLR